MIVHTKAQLLNRYHILFILATIIFVVFTKSTASIIALVLSIYTYLLFIFERNIIEISLKEKELQIIFFKIFTPQLTCLEFKSIEITSKKVVRFRGGIDYEFKVLDRLNNQAYFTTKKLFGKSIDYELLIDKLDELGIRIIKNY